MTSSSQFSKFFTQLIEVSDGYDDDDHAQRDLEFLSDDAEQYLKEDYAELVGQQLLDEADYYNNLFLDSINFSQGEY
jgi:hypothetical protein